MFKEKNLTPKEIDFIKTQIFQEEAILSRQNRVKVTINDFQLLEIIGKGAFGEVRVCRHIRSNEIYAIKMLKKHEMYEKHKILQVMIEKEILCQANSKWIVDLKYSFQARKS